MMQQFHYEGYNVLMKAYTTDRSLRIATVWLRQTDRWSSLYAITRSLRLFIVICLANVASFLLPYAILLMPSDVGYTFEMSIRNLPRYIVGFGYLFLTLIAEVPVVYISLKKFITNKKRFLMTIIIVNAVTTIMVAIIERVICKGSW